MRIVLDTNVLVSSLLKRDSNPATILDAVLAGKIQLVVDDRIFREYEDVLHRPRLKISSHQANAILEFIHYSALWVTCQSQPFQYELIQDLGDVPFAETAICGHVEVLITGNMKHFQFLANSGLLVLLPHEFLEKYRHMI